MSGLLNSTAIQDLASTIPPGQVRTSDLEQLGMLLIPNEVAQVSALSTALADDVAALARTHALRFPQLLEALRDDLSLGEVPLDAWLPQSRGPFDEGELHRIGWLREISPRGAQSSKAVSVASEATLFGENVVVHGQGGQCLTLRVDEDEADLRETLEAHIRGLIATGVRLRDIATAAVPTNGSRYVQSLVDDLAALDALVSQYRTHRRAIDDIVDTIL